MGQLFFDEESIHEISKPDLKFVTDGRTDARTDGQAKSNMPLQLFQSWGRIKKIFGTKLLMVVKKVPNFNLIFSKYLPNISASV